MDLRTGFSRLFSQLGAPSSPGGGGGACLDRRDLNKDEINPKGVTGVIFYMVSNLLFE